jgi:hypothetical protein
MNVKSRFSSLFYLQNSQIVTLCQLNYQLPDVNMDGNDMRSKESEFTFGV